MQIHLDKLKVVPCLLMMVLAFQLAFDFNAVGMSTVSYAMLAMMLGASLCSLFLVARQRTITLMDLFYIVFMVILLTSSLLNGTDTKQLIYLSLSILLVRFLFNFYQGNLSPLIIGLVIGFSIATFAQLHQLLTHPDLWIIREDHETNGYILGGNYNQIGSRLIITLSFTLLCTKISRWFYLLLVPCALACVAIPLMVGSMTATTCIILLFLLCLIPSGRLRRISFLGIMISVVLFQVFVCFSGKSIENNELMTWFIEDVLGKDITFTDRTNMWDSALQVITQSPIWGYGLPDGEWYLTHMSNAAIGPHNMILGVLIMGGILALMFYLYSIAVSLSRTLSVNDYWADCIVMSISVLCLMMLMEVYPISIVFTFFTIAEYYPQLHWQLTSCP